VRYVTGALCDPSHPDYAGGRQQLGSTADYRAHTSHDETTWACPTSGASRADETVMPIACRHRTKPVTTISPHSGVVRDRACSHELANSGGLRLLAQPLSRTLAGIAVVAVLAAALLLCVWVLPHRWYPPLSNADLPGLSPADQAARREGRDRLQNDARTTLLQGLAGLLVLVGAGIGAGVTLRQVRIGREQLEHARQQAQLSDDRAREQLELAREQAQRSDERLREQIAVAQEGQITERFTRAVDQLGQPGNDRLDVRLGGIYTLERIAHDSPTHRLAVVEILTAFVRSHAPWPPHLPGQYHADAPINQVPSLQTRAPDVQATLNVIGRRPTQKDDSPLDLTQTDLRQANLIEAKLTEAQLEGANLENAGLEGANLENAWLKRANLKGASLIGANLKGARLERANLGAWLERANLKGASLTGANLKGAGLEGANLEGARLQGANLEGAWLEKARANGETIWPKGWDRTRRAAAGVDEKSWPAASSPGESPNP
jgi:Pentapeptide repeats (8 copies)